MNCLEYRQQIEAEPNQHSESLSRHAVECKDCADFKRKIMRFDQRLNQALAVNVPENLEAKILLRQSFQARQRRSWGRRSLRAIAAGILIMLGLAGSGTYFYFDQQNALENELITVVNTATHAMAAKGPVPNEKITQVFDSLGFSISESLGQVSFAGKCLVQGELAGHMIVRQNGQPITLIFFPKRNQLLQATFASKQWQGVLVPVASGTVAIIAPPELALGALREQVKKRVHWDAAV